MDKRTAKREACFRAAMVIESALGSGWEELDRYGADDRLKVEVALGELCDELIRRSAGPSALPPGDPT